MKDLKEILFMLAINPITWIILFIAFCLALYF